MAHFREFPEGTKVRAWMTGPDHRGGDCVEGIVRFYAGDILHIIVTKPSSNFRHYKMGSECPVWADTAEPLVVFDPKKPVAKTRAGYPVSDLKVLGKFVMATVKIPKLGDIRLHFNEHGHIYKDIESPVDLVNA